MAAVLTAINVADDFFKAYESEAALKKELKKTQDELEKQRKPIKQYPAKMPY
jgi:cell division protein ZapA